MLKPHAAVTYCFAKKLLIRQANLQINELSFPPPTDTWLTAF